MELRVFQDSYMEFLRSKYPHWKPASAGAPKRPRPSDTLVNRLLTTEYNWDEERDQRVTYMKPFQQSKLREDIPSGGPLLDSDLKRIRRRLKEIAEQMAIMRETRLNLTTEEYLRGRTDPRAILDDGDDPLAAVRSRLSEMALRTIEPVLTPTSEQIAFMKFDEQRDAYIADIRTGRIAPSTQEEPPKQMVFATASTSPPAVDEPSEPRQQSKDVPSSGEQTTTQHKSDVEQPAEDPRKSELIRFQNEPDEQQAPTAQAASNQQSSLYEKMVGLFRNTSTSDTDDDVSVEKPQAVRTKPLTSTPAQPLTKKGSAGTLSQYLAASSSANKDATPSDSDDDFFK
ncbi:unnamed protein product [Heligmosomoides polygyrus]|uniref:Uncharacterized protein n=1 Tax=Heligmosomoides polygyrus TaxID=6339 RepID=A0A183FL94_HELPZ|nr:unnamed protein product [Heligmosomoides polygyrus]